MRFAVQTYTYLSQTPKVKTAERYEELKAIAVVVHD